MSDDDLQRDDAGGGSARAAVPAAAERTRQAQRRRRAADRQGPCVDYPRRAAQWLDALRASARGAPPAPDDAPPPWQALGLRVEHVDALRLARGDRRDGVLYADHTISLGAGAHAAYAFAEERLEMRAGATLGGFAYAPNVDIDNTLVRGAVVGQAVRVHGCGGFANLHGTPIVFGRLAHAPGATPR